MDIKFSDFLRHWRTKRHLSQLQLAMQAGVSARHISFLESGRSNPSKPMIILLAQSLQIPKAATNQAFLAAGFAPVFKQHPQDHSDIAQINQAVATTLENHMPLPAIVLDRHWNITNANPAATRLIGGIGLSGHSNLIEATTSDTAVRRIENWPEASLLLLQRLRQEYLESGGDKVLGALIKKLRARIQQELGDHPPDIDYSQAVLPTRFVFEGHKLSLFSAIAQFGSVFDTNLADIRIELMFPLNAETRTYFTQIPHPETPPLPPSAVDETPHGRTPRGLGRG